MRKRLARRISEVGAPSLAAYAALLERQSDEWVVLDAICRIPISRFYRDRSVFEVLVRTILPERAREAHQSGRAVRAWSAGCASGEEPYTLSIAWQCELASSFPDVAFEVLATDVDEGMLARAQRGCYTAASLRELPERWSAQAFRRDGPSHCVRDDIRARVHLRREDLRSTAPEDTFDLVLCRNVAFTYFDGPLQRAVALRLAERIKPGGVLVLGVHETLPSGIPAFALRARCIYERVPRAANAQS